MTSEQRTPARSARILRALRALKRIGDHSRLLGVVAWTRVLRCWELLEDQDRLRHAGRAGVQADVVHPALEARRVPGDLVDARALARVLDRGDLATDDVEHHQ